VPGMVPDNDVEGYFKILLQHLASDSWRDVWSETGFTVETFASLGLLRDVADDVLWKTCQQRQVILVTGNRTKAGPTSLESTIRIHNAPDCLPVLTLADPKQIKSNKPYAERVVERLLEYLVDIENLRGTGRLYLP